VKVAQTVVGVGGSKSFCLGKVVLMEDSGNICSTALAILYTLCSTSQSYCSTWSLSSQLCR